MTSLREACNRDGRKIFDSMEIPLILMASGGLQMEKSGGMYPFRAPQKAHGEFPDGHSGGFTDRSQAD